MEINDQNPEKDFEREKQKVEALLFASDTPVTIKSIMQITEIMEKDLVIKILETLKTEYNQTRRSFQIVEVANGFQLMTRPEFAYVVEKLYGESKRYRLTRSALETLAIIAYKQPITKPLLDRIRGVDSGYILNKLLEYDLIKILGRSEKPGRPLVIGTTENFLQYFGLKKLSDMPKLEELGDLDSFEEEIEIGQEELPFTPDFGENEEKEKPAEKESEPEVEPEPEQEPETESKDETDDSNSTG